MQKGLTALFWVVKLADPTSLNRVVTTLEEHFTLSANEIALAYQNSYESALNAIIAGLDKPSLLDSKVMEEFANQIGPNYLQPFLRARSSVQRHLAQQSFCADTIAKCNALIRYKASLFQVEQTSLNESDLAALVTDSGSLSITELVIEQLEALDKTRYYLDDPFCEFLRYNNLLGTGMLFFLHEQLRQEQRVAATLNALQLQGLWQDVRDIKHFLTQLMTRLDLSAQIKPRDELTSHNSNSLKLIREAVACVEAVANQ